MLIIIFGILALVYASKYKKQPLLKTRNTTKVFSIILSVLVGLEAFTLLSYITLMATGSFFNIIEQAIHMALQGMDFGSGYITGIIGDISDFISTVMWISMITEVIIFVFGLIALIKGFSTINNPQLRAAAEANTASMNAGNQQSYTYYQQSPASTYTENTQSYSTTTAPATEQTPSQNWFCTSCGASNIAIANFCSSCGNKRQ